MPGRRPAANRPAAPRKARLKASPMAAMANPRGGRLMATLGPVSPALLAADSSDPPLELGVVVDPRAWPATAAKAGWATRAQAAITRTATAATGAIVAPHERGQGRARWDMPYLLGSSGGIHLD